MLDILRSDPKTMDIDQIQIDGGTQMRSEINREMVAEYADALQDGARFPPIIAFYDGTHYWLGDGFHRHRAHEVAGIDTILVDVRSGTQRDAILYAAGANADHGLRRTSADKRRAVTRLLSDTEWAEWSNREIARRCNVSEAMVRSMRRELTAHETQSQTAARKYIDRHGNESVMRTGKIGASAPAVDYVPPPQRKARAAKVNVTRIDAVAWREPVGGERDEYDIRAPMSGEVTGIMSRLSVVIGDLERCKKILGMDNLTIIERAESHCRIVLKLLDKIEVIDELAEGDGEPLQSE